PESFDYPRYLRRQGIFAVAQAGSPEGWIRLRPASYFYRKAAAWGRFLHAELAELPNRPERGVLVALLLGDGTWLEAATAEDFRRCGLTHVLVVSGLHFTLVLLCFYFPWYLLFSLRAAWADSGAARRWALGFALPPTWFYGLLVGLTPSVLR